MIDLRVGIVASRDDSAGESEIKNCAGWATAASNRRWPPLDFSMLTGAVMDSRASVSCTPAMKDWTGLMYASPIVVLDRSYSRQVGETSCEIEIATWKSLLEPGLDSLFVFGARRRGGRPRR